MQPLVRFALMLALSTCGLAFAQDERFDIRRFAVEGNTLLAPAHIEGLVAPFLGAKRNYGDIQKALEALEGAYRSGGYGTVQVYVPEQELTHGVVRLQVTEGVIGKISIIGNKHFDSDNVRGTLPSLAPGKAPNMRQISEDIQLANENPAKQIEVTLGVSEEEGKVDAKVNVTDDNPEKFIVSLDNTGTAATGKWRAGFAYQNANVGNRDQVVTVAYTDSPDKPSGVKVEIYSFAYRLPLYSIGDSVDIIYGKSSVNTPNAQATGFSLNGKGDVLGLRWNHYFARRGEYTSKLIGGFDYKYINTRCLNNATGAAFHIDPPTPGNAACTPYTVRPFSLTYTGQRQSPGQILDYSLGVYQNWATGSTPSRPRSATCMRCPATGRCAAPSAANTARRRCPPANSSALPARRRCAASMNARWRWTRAISSTWRSIRRNWQATPACPAASRPSAFTISAAAPIILARAAATLAPRPSRRPASPVSAPGCALPSARKSTCAPTSPTLSTPVRRISGPAIPPPIRPTPRHGVTGEAISASSSPSDTAVPAPRFTGEVIMLCPTRITPMRRFRVRIRLLTVAVAACYVVAPAWALPADPLVLNGSAAFDQSGKVLNVTNSNGAIIDWNSFSIGAGETTRFIQPSASSSVLNRVVGADPSLIYGTLTSNGQVWLINPAGIMIGAGGRIDPRHRSRQEVHRRRAG